MIIEPLSLPAFLRTNPVFRHVTCYTTRVGLVVVVPPSPEPVPYLSTTGPTAFLITRGGVYRMRGEGVTHPVGQRAIVRAMRRFARDVEEGGECVRSKLKRGPKGK